MADERIRKVEAAYAEIDEAFRNKDLDAVARHTAPDWSGTTGEKTVTRDQLLENVRMQFETLENISWNRTVNLVSADDDRIVAKATGVFRAVKRANGDPVELNLANEDTWRRGPTGWQVSHSVALEPGA